MARNEAAELHLKPFPRSEYDRRIERVREEMRRVGADLLIVDAVEHMAYLFGYVPPAAIYQPALLPLSGEPLAIVRALDEPTFNEQSWVRDKVLFRDWDDSVETLVAALRERGWATSRIAFEFDSHFLPVKRFRAIEAALPEARIVDFAGILREIRLIKSPHEIAYLRFASAIADRAIMAAIDAAGVGVPERECAAALYAEALRAGADNGRSALMASGKRSDSLHGRLGARTLQDGDILHVESVPLFNGYGARLMRSTAIGAAGDDVRSAAARLIECQDRQFEAMRPGAAAGEVDAVLRKAVLSCGLRSTYENFTGYTLGYIGLPATSDFTRAFLPDSKWVLQAGMVFHMYTYAKGFAFSDTILITESGPEPLTKTPRQLFIR